MTDREEIEKLLRKAYVQIDEHIYGLSNVMIAEGIEAFEALLVQARKQVVEKMVEIIGDNEAVLDRYDGLHADRNQLRNELRATLREEIQGAFDGLSEPKASGNQVDNIGEISDGYHTFNELYEFRLLYHASYANLVYFFEQQYGGKEKPVKSWRHSDGELCFGGGWFIVTQQLPTGQITNHYAEKDWQLFQIPEVEKAPEWDGHTAQDVAKRLRRAIEGTDLAKSDKEPI